MLMGDDNAVAHDCNFRLCIRVESNYVTEITPLASHWCKFSNFSVTPTWHLCSYPLCFRGYMYIHFGFLSSSRSLSQWTSFVPPRESIFSILRSFFNASAHTIYPGEGIALRNTWGCFTRDRSHIFCAERRRTRERRILSLQIFAILQ